MEKLNSDKKSLRNFGITMGFAFLTIAIFILTRHRHSASPAFLASAAFFIFAFAAPGLLKPVYASWMRLALILSWINTRFILSVIFYFLIAPIGLAVRLFNRDLLDRRIEKNKDSYWKEKEKKDFNPLDYERQF